MLFSNVVSGFKKSALILFFILICSKFSSNDVRGLEIFFSCTNICDEKLPSVSFRTSVGSERNSVYELIGTSYFSFFSILVFFPL